MDHNNFAMDDLVVPFKKFVEDVDKFNLQHGPISSYTSEPKVFQK